MVVRRPSCSPGYWQLYVAASGAVLCCDAAIYVDTAFILSTEEGVYASCLELVVDNDGDLSGSFPVTHTLEYVDL